MGNDQELKPIDWGELQAALILIRNSEVYYLDMGFGNLLDALEATESMHRMPKWLPWQEL
jgi:hypothetical protein